MQGPIVKNSKTIILLAPVSVTAAPITATYAQFSMAKYKLAVIDVICGVLSNSADAMAVTLVQGTAVGSGTPKALAFSRVFILNPADTSPASDADKWVETAVTSNTYNIAGTDDGKVYRHEIRADDLDAANGYDCAGISIGSPGSNACLFAIVVNLFNPRYYGGVDTSRTPTALV